MKQYKCVSVLLDNVEADISLDINKHNSVFLYHLDMVYFAIMIG